MKPAFRWLIAIFVINVNTNVLFAQTTADVFDESKTITWLGLDFSLTEFIGSPQNTEMTVDDFGMPHGVDKGLITNDEFRDVYTVAWNQLFIDEPKKYSLDKATHHKNIKCAIDVTVKANKALKKEFFSNNPSDFSLIKESAITDAVKNYDFQQNEGIGLMFFVEGMSKGMLLASVWVTYVDMKTKTVLFIAYMTGKPGGGGFRNYWARPYTIVLKDMETSYASWKMSHK